MKNNLFIALILVALSMVSCKKSFTDRPALDGPSLDNFYNTAEQVKGATGTLYGASWFNYNDKALSCIGEVLSGNAFTGDPVYSPFQFFTVSSADDNLNNAWGAFYDVIGSANVLINAFETKKSLGGDSSILNPGIAEARFMRGTVVFFIARIWGDAPLITDPAKLAASGEFAIPRYYQSDLLRFAIEDLQYAEEHLPGSDTKGRVTSWSAKGMMAKVYLYQKEYAKAKQKAEEVINSNKYGLFEDYYGMFSSSANNNNKESLFALQWIGSATYGIGNSLQAYTAPGNLISPDGWSSVVPSIDLLRSYEANDKRRRWSIMEQGNVYPNYLPSRPGNDPNIVEYNEFMKNGYVYDTGSTAQTRNNPLLNVRTQTLSHFSKYVVGPSKPGEPVFQQSTSINTYILRYADILLIYAESIMAGAPSTADPDALDAFNQVRNRAQLGDVAIITQDVLLHERRVEFAFEGDYWFDIQRQGLARAQAIVAAQERGSIDYAFPGGINSRHAVLSLPYKDLFLPIPVNEVVKNPKLSEPAVNYY